MQPDRYQMYATKLGIVMYQTNFTGLMDIFLTYQIMVFTEMYIFLSILYGYISWNENTDIAYEHMVAEIFTPGWISMLR